MTITAGSLIVATGNGSNNQTTLAAVTTAALTAGQFAIAIFATDNTITTDVQTDDVCSGITDTDSGSWSKIGSFTNGQGGALLGVTVQVWLRQPGPALASGGTITFTLMNTANRDATACTVYSFNCDTDQILPETLTGTFTQIVDGGTLTSAAALAPTSAAGERLRIRACGCDFNVATNLTPTSGWTVMNTACSDTAGATPAAEIMALGEYVISTTVNHSSDPTHATSSDWASVYVVVEEVIIGDLRGTFNVTGAVTNPTNMTGSVPVAIGDLIFVVWDQAAAISSTGVTDNLGNSYTAQNAGTDTGGLTGKTFYSIATVAGTLTQISTAFSSTGSSCSAVAGVFKGPFSAIDANPANNSDTTSPFSCPATGTLAQAAELIIAWGAHNGGVTSATAPNTLAVQAVSATFRSVLGYQKVAATTTVTPEFTATVGADTPVWGTASFKVFSGVDHQATLVLAATSTLLANALEYIPASAVLSADSSLAVDASIIAAVEEASSVLATTSTLQINTFVQRIASAVLNATSALAANGLEYSPATAKLSAGSSLIVSSFQYLVSNAVVAATGNLIANGLTLSPSTTTVVLAATSTLTVNALEYNVAASVLNATSTLTVNALEYNVVSAVLNATSSLIAKGSVSSKATVVLAGTSTIAAQATIPNQPNLWQHTVVIAPQINVIASTRQIQLAASVWNLTSALAASASLRLPASARLPLTSALVVDTTTRFLYFGTSVFSLGSALVATAILRELAKAVLAGTSSLSSDAYISGRITCDATLPLRSSVTVSANVKTLAKAVLSSTSNLTVATKIYRPAISIFAGTSSLSTNAKNYKPASVSLVFTTTLSISTGVVHQISAVAVLAATSTLTANITPRPLISANIALAGVSTLRIDSGIVHQLLGSAILPLGSGLRASAIPRLMASITLAVTSRFIANGTQRIPLQATANLIAVSSLSATAKQFLKAQAIYKLASTLVVTTTQRWAAFSRLSGTSTLRGKALQRLIGQSRLPLNSQFTIHLAVDYIRCDIRISSNIKIDAIVHVPPPSPWLRRVGLQGDKKKTPLQANVAPKQYSDADI
jgi:hypothetical protein